MLERCKSGSYVPELFENIGSCLKAANKLPVQDDHAYFTQFPEYEKILVDNKLAVLGVLEKLSKVFGFPLNTFPEIQKAANGCLLKVSETLADLKEPLALQACLVHTIPKPQHSFKSIIDNSERVFIPKILYKYHAKIDVPPGILKAQQLVFLEAREDVIETSEPVAHPYQYELDTLSYQQSQFSPESSYFNTLESTIFEFISTEKDFYKMIQELRLASEISIDLENHSIRSYLGFCCLIQISTRDKDYIVDPFSLACQIPVLGVIFADPRIVKVFHGSDMDIEWLQRDFGLYVVNLFDTGLAAKELRYPSFSLAFLLKSFCDIDTDKRYQLADWRLRPLTNDMIKYARTDTHYLLYIYDRLKEELITKSITLFQPPHTSILNVLENSRKICLKMYKKHSFYPDENNLYSRLLKTRDLIARIEDESPEFVVPHTALLAIASKSPRTLSELLNTYNSPYMLRYGLYILKKITQLTPSSNFSENFFKDAGWTETENLPYSAAYESLKNSDIHIGKVLTELSEIINTGKSPQVSIVTDTKSTIDINNLLESTLIDENSIPDTSDKIFDISNNSRKKNKNKIKLPAENSSGQEKPNNLNLNKIFKEIGWGV